MSKAARPIGIGFHEFTLTSLINLELRIDLLSGTGEKPLDWKGEGRKISFRRKGHIGSGKSYFYTSINKGREFFNPSERIILSCFTL